MLQRLTYVSTLSPHAAGQLMSTVEDILVVSVAQNRRDDLTGFLLCDGVAFVQALEGPAAAVESCFERIRRDPRHLRLELRERGAIRSRLFPRWSMCGLTLSPADDLLLTAPDIDFELREATEGALLQLLTGLADRHGGELDAVHRRMLDSLTG